jgi:hypothetical protein
MFLSQLFESITPKHASFCFGRMNPPTLGHGQLINTVAKAARGGDYFIFVSQTQDKKKNPLDYATKIKFINALFPDQANHVVYDPELKTIMQIAQWLYNNDYRDVTFVAGSDRLESFEKLLNDYNGREGGNVYYKFDTINFVSSGERDPDADGIAGVSASGAREAAVNNDINAFAQATGAGKLTQPLYQAVRKGMLLADPELAEDRAEVYNNITHAYINANRQGKKVVKSAGGYFKIADKTDPAPALAPNEDYLAKQRSIINRLGEIDKEYRQTVDLPYNTARNQLSSKLWDSGNQKLKDVTAWVNGLGKLQSQYFNTPASMKLNIEKRELNKELTALRKTVKSYIELAEALQLDKLNSAGLVKGDRVEHNLIGTGTVEKVEGNSVYVRPDRNGPVARFALHSVKRITECSGYIPKNKKEAKDPRWSNSLTVDIKPGAINKNLKALRLI